RLIVFKELDESVHEQLGALDSLGYVRGDVPPAHLLDLPFLSFDEYMSALQSGYRKQIRRSQRKFDAINLRFEHASGATIADVFTDQVHQLYLAVLERAKYRLE